MKKLYKALPAVVFVAFIAVMLVMYIVLPKEKVSTSEKRPLAEMPAFSVESFFSGEFKEDFESYLSDHAPWRNFWVGANSYVHLLTGQYSTGHPTPKNNYKRGYYYGSDGYIINEPQDMTDLMLNIGYIEECAQHMSVPTTVLIAPSTGYICEDKLPSPHYAYTDDEYFAQMSDTLRTAKLVDVRELFKSEYAAGNQIYYRTDHHWTAYGAYTAYRALADELGYTPLSRRDYEITSYDGFYGTTYSSSGFWLTEPDTIEVWDNKANDGSLSVTITDGGDVTEQGDMFYYSHLDEDDKYPVYLDGNHPYTVIKNANATSDEKLLIVKDSFAHSLTPFLADHYAEIIMVDMRYYANPIPELVKQEGIDRVLFVYSIDNLAKDDRIALIE